jgi:hypothetical protein
VLITAGGIVLIALVSIWAGALVAWFDAGVTWSGRAIKNKSRKSPSAN